MSDQIDQFFRPDGTLISIPVKLPKKLAVLRLIASELSPDTKYPAKQLNEIIAKFHPDTAALRRHMIEYGILERDGESVYWLSKGMLVLSSPKSHVEQYSQLEVSGVGAGSNIDITKRSRQKP
jgi:hypothetical protein